MTVKYLTAARTELKEAARYYHDQKSGLGDDFVREVQATIERIVENPSAWIEIAPRIRRALTNRFPYAVLYHVREDVLIIVAIMHQHRYPSYWRDRINQLSS